MRRGVDSTHPRVAASSRGASVVATAGIVGILLVLGVLVLVSNRRRLRRLRRQVSLRHLRHRVPQHGLRWLRGDCGDVLVLCAVLLLPTHLHRLGVLLLLGLVLLELVLLVLLLVILLLGLRELTADRAAVQSNSC